MDAAAWNHRNDPASDFPGKAAAAETGAAIAGPPEHRQPSRPRSTSPSNFPLAAVGVDSDRAASGSGNGRGPAGSDDGSSRTSSAYILLQLRDLGRSPSNPDASTVVNGSVVAAAATAGSSRESVSSTATSTPPPSFASGTSGARQLRQQQQQQEQRNNHRPPQHERFGQEHQYHQYHHQHHIQQHQQQHLHQKQLHHDEYSTLSHSFGTSPNSTPPTPTDPGDFAGGGQREIGATEAAAAALNRGMYVPRLPSGFEQFDQPGGPATAAAASRVSRLGRMATARAVATSSPSSSYAGRSMLSQQQQQQQQQALAPTRSSSRAASAALAAGGGGGGGGGVAGAGSGGSAALRPICPKGTVEPKYVVNPATGKLVPVSACVCYTTAAHVLCVGFGPLLKMHRDFDGCAYLAVGAVQRLIVCIT